MEQVILVNPQDEPIGLMGKIEAHKKGLLHRAFSIFIFNKNGEMLLQQRAFEKYHSGGLWTNTCCSHPQPGENTAAAAVRRLQQEMGFQTELKKSFSFVYKTAFDNGLIEHEVDHVFIGEYEGAILPNVEEVYNYEYRSMNSIREAIQSTPQLFTSWFKIAFPTLETYLTTTSIK
ncbi:MAG: isopentenyl-diphosphate Delta-isomerase [Ferruginibacter sp.]